MTDLSIQLGAHLRATRESATLVASQVSNALTAANQPVYRLGFGQSPFPVPESVVATLRASAHRKEYLAVQGLDQLREQAARFHSELGDRQWHAGQVIVGAGSKILLYSLMAAVTDADVVLVTPGWVSYEPQAKLAGHRVHRLQTKFEERWRLTPDALDRFCRGRYDPERPLLLVLNYPGNPDGLSYSGPELDALARVMRQHGVLVISDEIYSLLHHEGSHVSISDFYPEGTIVTTGLSKWCGAGGWRLGIALVPEQLGEAYLQGVVGVCSETFSCAPTPVQYAAVSAYAMSEDIQRFVAYQRDVLSDLGNHCAHSLQQADVAVHAPDGGFYLFPDFGAYRDRLARRGIATGEDFTRRLLAETGVCLLPGSAFGMDEHSLTARLAYVDFEGGDGLRQTRCDLSRTEQGVERLCAWLDR